MNTSDVPPDSPPLLPQAPALDNTYGAGLIGTAVGLMLFGLTVHQVYRYFRLYPTDPKYIKIYVVVLLIIETFHIVISLHTCYFYLITNYLQPGAFLVPIWSVNTVPLATGVVAVVSQCFFAHRVWLVGPQFRPLVLISVSLLLKHDVAATIETYVRPLYRSYWSVTWVFSASFGVAIVVDSVLTGTLITILHRSRTGIKRTDSMIDLLIVYSVNTGRIFNILTFTFALVYPDNIIYGGFAIVTAKLYANSVLAALNARKSLIKGPDGLEMDSLGLSFAAGPTERATTVTTADPRRTVSSRDLVPFVVIVIDIIKPQTLHDSTAGTDDDADDRQEAKGASLTVEAV
ncbi:hypothetical protein C8Q73DRAFT_633999 [Cubamyces lactineus]|nr:hypothetical protein C8Q73DRAFT_633999 [Cubamyces lactineus]